MDLKVFVAGLFFLIMVQEAHITSGEDCQIRRESLPPGRSCKKSCSRDSDCRSKKKSCKCDGICGKSCIKHNQKCQTLNQIPHGKVEIYPYNTFGAIAQYSCNDGYVRRGEQARVCQGDESWSGEAPTCYIDRTIETVECLSPPLVNNAMHDEQANKKTFALGTMLQYSCNAGYSLQRDGVLRAWCVGGGVWVGPNMTCNNAGCDRLESIDNGFVDQNPSNNIGSIASYRCMQGFFLAGRDSRICGLNGEWDGVQPSCEKVTCGKPPEVDFTKHNGDLDQERFPSWTQLEYTCSYGYYKDGNPKAMCNGEGKWIGLTLACSPRSCGFPGDVDNGWRTGYSFTYPNKVDYFCHDGFELTGVGYRTCQASGLWSDDLPTCEPVNCPTLYAPVYGRMYNPGNAYGTVIRFDCDEGYKVVGSIERRCLADRTWSGQLAKCEEINCGWPAPFYNGYLIGHKTTVGAVIFFSCNTRTTLDGPAFQTQCLETGKWSDPPPKCWGQCHVAPIANASLVEGRELTYVNHGTVIEFRCKNGLVPHDSSSMRCNNGTWSSEAKCVPAPCPSAPPHVYNGIRIFMGQDHGFRAKYKCFSGFKLTGTNSSYLTCHFGEWIGGRPHCEEFYCQSPKKLEHGHLYKKVTKGRFDFPPYIRMIKHGDRLEYECDTGYRLLGPSGATCVNGQWQPSLVNPGTKCVPAIHPPFRKLWTPIPNMYTTKS